MIHLRINHRSGTTVKPGQIYLKKKQAPQYLDHNISFRYFPHVKPDRWYHVFVKLSRLKQTAADISYSEISLFLYLQIQRTLSKKLNKQLFVPQGFFATNFSAYPHCHLGIKNSACQKSLQIHIRSSHGRTIFIIHSGHR